ncbi:glycosyltransferase [Isobaculum melis]|uniref:Glycosyltransferase involved in cell wall bisynthesis n=1 Tax=Isobaculum melis TaxID=142588 RepID=A0A1H9QPB6_9LACT|nr:glycosyltransferase [Isobaculum melis]SER62346.1 Glycosyltransferase involved in cell wall bisynthesis [Isobaculum melis]
MVKIIVNDIAASKDSGGAFSILQEFYEAVRLYGADHEWVFMLADSYFEETENIKIESFPEIKSSWMKRFFFDFFYGHKVVEAYQGDLYFSLQNMGLRKLNMKQIVYLQQLLPFQQEKNFSFFKKDERKLAIYQKVIGRLTRYSLKYVSEIFVQTNYFKGLLGKKVNPKMKIHVVPPNIKMELGVTKNDGKQNNQFFFPAAQYIYKNHETLFEASRSIVEQGEENFTVVTTLEVSQQLDQNKIPQLKYLGLISREQVFEYYQHSILVFPSYIETFGLPLAEAKLFESIVLAADTPFAREVLKDYENAYFFDTFNHQQLADLMIKCINGEIVKKEVGTTVEVSEEDSWQEVIATLTHES